MSACVLDDSFSCGLGVKTGRMLLVVVMIVDTFSRFILLALKEIRFSYPPFSFLFSFSIF